MITPHNDAEARSKMHGRGRAENAYTRGSDKIGSLGSDIFIVLYANNPYTFRLIGPLFTSRTLLEMDSPDLDLSPTPELPEAHHNDATEHPLENAQDDPIVQAADTAATKDDVSDLDSELSDVDEAQFEDFDPNQITIEERPAIAVDEDNVRLLGRHKRKRDEADGEKKKRKKEKTREKPRKSRKKKDSDDDFSGAEQLEGKRARKKKPFLEGEGRKEKARPEKPRPVEEDENLDPEERRRRALDRAMDAALKNPNKRRRRADEIDLASQADEEIADLRNRMIIAAQADVAARNAKPPLPAMAKLKLLPEVTALLNRNSRDIQNAICDPETNLLQSVTYFLEPLEDGSLPAYNIQRVLFDALAKLPIDKDALISSGLGKVILFYTKSKKPETYIKRAAERLYREWSRPILKRSDDYRQRDLATAEYDPTAPRRAIASQMSTADAAALARAKALAPPVKSSRARAEVEQKTYHIVPKSSSVHGGAFARPLGASGEDAFRRMKMRHQAQMGATKKTGR